MNNAGRLYGTGSRCFQLGRDWTRTESNISLEPYELYLRCWVPSGKFNCNGLVLATEPCDCVPLLIFFAVFLYTVSNLL